MKNQSPNNRRNGFLIFRGVLRIFLGTVLILNALVMSLGLAVSFFDPQAGADAAAAVGVTPEQGDDSAAGVFGLACLGYGVWFFLSGLMLVRAGRRTTYEEAPTNWSPVPEFGPLDTGLLLLVPALAALIAMVKSILGLPVEFGPAEQTSSSVLLHVSFLVAVIGLIWFGVKAVRMSGSEPERTELETGRNVRSPARFVVLNLCSGFFYTGYWIYRNWEDIKRDDSSNISPYWRTVGAIIPFLGVALVYEQLKDIYRLAESRGIRPRHAFSLIFVCFLVPTILSSVLFVWWVVSRDPLQNPSPAFDLITYFLLLVSILPLISVQGTINRMWETSLPEPVPQESLSGAEAIWVFVGALVLMSTVLQHVPAF